MGISMEDEDGWNRWVYYQYFVGASVANDNTLHLLARTYDLFLTDHPGTQVGERTMTAWVTKATGIEPDRLWAILFGFLAHFYTIKASEVHRATAWISRERFFDAFGFSRDEVDAFFRLVALPAGEVANELKDHFSLADPRPYDLLPIARSPLVVVGDFAICPYMRLLLDRMTMGLYHILLNAESEESPEGRQARGQFQHFVGNVWENYVDRLLKRVAGASPEPRPLYLGPKEIARSVSGKRGTPPPSADHVLVYGDTAVILDSKAKFMPMKVRMGLDRDLFVSRFSELCVSGARQLDATVEHLRAGKFDQFGVDGRSIRSVYPVLVSLADYPMQPWGNEWIRRRVAQAGFLKQPGVASLELLTASDIDLLEQPLTAGQSMAAILRAKAGDGGWSLHSFHNWSVQRGPTYLRSSRSPYLQTVYEQITSRSEEILRDRKG